MFIIDAVMKKFLPRTANNPQGFTLVELMVVITIIAILSVVGVTVFSSAQKNARDGRRRAEIQAIANALETNKTPNGTYNVLAGTQFASGVIPVDSGNGSAAYCVDGETTVGAAAPTAAAAWVNSAACPTNYSAVSSTAPAASTTAWTLCALLENATVYCKQSSQ